MDKKIYCGGCKYLKVLMRDWLLGTGYYCSKQNPDKHRVKTYRSKHNSVCEDYKRKWYKVWR